MEVFRYETEKNFDKEGYTFLLYTVFDPFVKLYFLGLFYFPIFLGLFLFSYICCIIYMRISFLVDNN